MFPLLSIWKLWFTKTEEDVHYLHSNIDLNLEKCNDHHTVCTLSLHNNWNNPFHLDNSPPYDKLPPPILKSMECDYLIVVIIVALHRINNAAKVYYLKSRAKQYTEFQWWGWEWLFFSTSFRDQVAFSPFLLSSLTSYAYIYTLQHTTTLYIERPGKILQ